MVQYTWKRASCFPITALLLGMVLLASAGTPTFGASAQASKLLQDVKMSATQMRRDAAQMQTYIASKVTWKSHAMQINTIKEHINNAGKVLAELHDARDGAEPWQQDAIDKITPLLQEMASNTESIINHLNDNKQTWHPGYTGYVRSNAELSDDLAKLIGDYIDYGNAKNRTRELGKKMGM
ncbi:MAG TPA: hypothetical protein VFQ24_16545 [Terriglobia bacterium]|nr:hypothetical protein [Terriglobia bacterium]